jgi:hypothetical protein
MTHDAILAEIEAAYADIPFGNSDYQNRAFVAAGELTPARAYRHIGLRMFNRLQAVKELQYGRAKEDIDLDEKRALIESAGASVWDKRRAELEIQKILDARSYQDKLLADALRELDCLYAEFKRLPRYTREQFELEERQHFQLRLERQLRIGDGAAASLDNMRIADEHWPQIVAEAHALLSGPEETAL